MTRGASERVEVAVVGAGPAGLVTALSVAETGGRVSLFGPRANPNDGRTAALFKASIALLKRLGAWDALVRYAEPITAIRLVDATGALWRAPEVIFRSDELGEEAFGYNVPNARLTDILESLATARVQRVITDGVSQIVPTVDDVHFATANDALYTATVLVAADGRSSEGRTAAGIGVQAWTYDQGAVVCGLTHSRPHRGISTEFHRRAGPLTIVPGPGNSSNLVWVDTLADARRLAAVDDGAFLTELSRHLQGLLGTVQLASTRRMFPLSGQTADTMARNRTVLIGEAAHVMPPIGAQGLNLSFRDAATLADILADARAHSRDIGGPETLAQYAAARRFDVHSRAWTVDVLNRSLLSEYAPIHALRGLGLVALKTFKPLRARVMREGVAPPQGLPTLMQSGR